MRVPSDAFDATLIVTGTALYVPPGRIDIVTPEPPTDTALAPTRLLPIKNPEAVVPGFKPLGTIPSKSGDVVETTLKTLKPDVLGTEFVTVIPSSVDDDNIDEGICAVN